MQIILILMGKTAESYIRHGMAEYEKRLKHYITFSIEELPALKLSKNISEDQIKQKEGEVILSKLNAADYIVLLDESGRQFSSVNFAEHLNSIMVRGKKRVAFIIGGAYGFSTDMYQRANERISLSPMTFSHQLVRLVFVEQLYRAFTILKGEKYHHS